MLPDSTKKCLLYLSLKWVHLCPMGIFWIVFIIYCTSTLFHSCMYNFFFIIKYKLSCYISAFSAFSFSSILLICSFHFFRCQNLFYIILLCANRNTTIWYNLCFIKISNLREQKNKKQMVKIFRISWNVC